ncbi:hypothetical protein P152DRAFT_391572 [Eremomyces bilateralis CBS 781.70]|uniref:Uncharacterized protein n=1 Tax=Eremomyces bilateralis CBS 781.70 TaxID=1392243 RepID=A0A6G1G9Y3_9PEZI|nr:uncharacterized protein P152DRAFT_391572 [Eremomyces bilateralis CBS 781.70]KAF1814720.1 hypothetical protein P152DRAFT_391572 [Eremomyces bilateralis CBS 781.70]
MDSILPYLLTQASNVVDVAAALHIFYDEIPQYRADIGDVLGLLKQIGDLLYAVEGAIATSPNARTSPTLAMDLNIFTRGQYYTLVAFRKMMRDSRPTAFGRPSYAAAWNLMSLKMRDEGCAVHSRLRMYITFLSNIIEAIRRIINIAEMADIRVRLTGLLHAQTPISGPYRIFGTPLINHQVPPPPPHPAHGMPGAFPGDFPSPISPISTTSGPSVGDEFFPMMSNSPRPTTPFAAPAPHSRHWATKIFEAQPPRSVFRVRGPRTKCLGRDDATASENLRHNRYQEVARVPFSNGALLVRLYLRDADQRAKVLVTGSDQQRFDMLCSMPITGLKCVRKRSYVELHRINREYLRPELWASLSFSTSEAMKSQDSSVVAHGLDDYISPLDYESVEFTGMITSRTFLHVLRIYRDLSTNSVRLEASPLRGKFAGKPIWTAFVTQFIGSRTWMELHGNVVKLLDLRPYMFCDGYELPRSQSGRYILTFTETRDARSFYETFHGIRTS